MISLTLKKNITTKNKFEGKKTNQPIVVSSHHKWWWDRSTLTQVARPAHGAPSMSDGDYSYMILIIDTPN